MSLGNFHSETKESNLNKNDKNVLQNEMSNFYCNVLDDYVISGDKYSQEKLYGGNGTLSKPQIGWGEGEAIPDKINYMNKNSDKVEPITTLT